MSANFAQLAEGPIFIGGMARSGTTWVYDILTAHPEVRGVHESWMFTPEDGVGVFFTRSHFPASKSGIGQLVSREELVTEIRTLIVSLFSRVLKPHHRFIVEKSPCHINSVALIFEIFPNARFVYILRDGRDVVVSVRSAVRSWAPHLKKTFGGSLMKCAAEWKARVKKAKSVEGSLADRFFEIRYEELKKNPFDSYRRLFDFCRIPYNDRLLQDIHDKTDFQKNYAANEKNIRRQGRVGDWKERLSWLDCLLFNLTAGKTLIDTGYEKSRFWLSSRIL